MSYQSIMHMFLWGESRALSPLVPALVLNWTAQSIILNSSFPPQSFWFGQTDLHLGEILTQTGAAWLRLASQRGPWHLSLHNNSPSRMSAVDKTQRLVLVFCGASAVKHSWNSLFVTNCVFPHAFGIMFVTNWLIWKRLMMRATVRLPAVAACLAGSLFYPSSPPPQRSAAVWSSHCAQWSEPSHWTGDSSDPSWNCGAQLPVVPCTIIRLPCLM